MKRNQLMQIIVLGVAVWIVLNHEDPNAILLNVHRIAYQACQHGAATLGRIGMELEKSYRVRVAP